MSTRHARIAGAWVCLAGSAAACNAILGVDKYRACKDLECDAATAGDGGADADGSTADVAIDAPPACNPDAAFAGPVTLTGIASSMAQLGGSFSADGKRFYFARQTGGNAGYQLWVSAVSGTGAFLTPTLVSDISDPDAASTNDYFAYESPDALRLYFFSYRSPATPGYGGAFYSNRPSPADPWQPPILFADGNTVGAGGMYPIPGALYQPYMFALYRLPVDSAGNIGTPVNVDGDAGSGINVGAKAVLNAVVTPDERHLYFCSQRSGPYIIWESHRADPGAPWGQPAPLPTSINTGSNDNPVYVTPDNCTLYYSSDGSGVLTMYKVTRGF